jgi:serine/threonine protein kinase
MIGQVVSHYRPLEKLGEGGMGVVYKAHDTKLDLVVAFKFLASQSIGDEDRARFIREAQAAASLSHPNIATVYEIDESDGQTFIAMEYVDDKSLRETIERGPLKLKEAINIAVEIARGLQAAHEKGIVHRDMKSANVMLTDKGQVKVDI